MTEAVGWVRLVDRRVIEVGGADRRSFLQGLISNDIERAQPDRAIYAALLTPQGKYMADFIVVDTGDAFLMDVPAERAAVLLQRLTMYKLRSAVDLAERDDLAVVALFGGGALAADGLTDERGHVVARDGVWHLVDPRLASMGARAIGTDASLTSFAHCFGEPVAADRYAAHRIALGVPEGGSDLVADKSLLLESGFVELDGVAFDKGCFVGQELTARMRYRTTVRKRLLPVRLEGVLPPPGTAVHAGDVEVGEIRSGLGDRAVAVLRLDRWRDAEAKGIGLQAGAAAVRPDVPAWVDLGVGAASKDAESSA